MKTKTSIARDISWLSFNERVLQEAGNPSVPLKERIKFLGIFSNNLDEFFRVRIAALRNMQELGNKAKMHLEEDVVGVLNEIDKKLGELQTEFERVWKKILEDLKTQNIFLLTDKDLSAKQKTFVLEYFNEEVRSFIIPLMIQHLQAFPTLNDKSIYLACRLSKSDASKPERLALVSVPVRHTSRFLILPNEGNKKLIILLEDVIRFCLPQIFSFFGYDRFTSHIIKLTRDAEIDIDNDIATSLMQKIEKGLKNRKKGKPVRFVYDKQIDSSTLEYLIKRLNLKKSENLAPGGRIHNFKDFMSFPNVFAKEITPRKKPFTHPSLVNAKSVTSVVLEQDVMLHFPYHSFNSVIDLLREAAIDPAVTSIKITCYRLASRSKIINALTNAVRNGKEVAVMLELRARFDEEANLDWKTDLEEAGVKVLIGVPNQKVHAKICLIKRKTNNINSYYGFVSTGNLNEKTSNIYSDHCLLTSNTKIMSEISKVFTYLENPKTKLGLLNNCKTIFVSPTSMRKNFLQLIEAEIKFARQKKKAGILIKLNSLSDIILINKLSEAALAGVEVRLIIRGICCMYTENSKFAIPIKAISIVDEYLEHSRVLVFHNNGNSKAYISSADLMVRNLDHRIEVACPIFEKNIRKELVDILEIQLSDNSKARVLDNSISNKMVVPSRREKKIRSQVEIYNFLKQRK